MDEDEFRGRLQIEVTVLDLWIEHGWLIPEVADGGRSFHDIDVARGLLVRDLSHAMGLNDAGIDVVMELVDQIHGLRSTLADLLDALGAQDDEVRQAVWRQIDRRARQNGG